MKVLSSRRKPIRKLVGNTYQRRKGECKIKVISAAYIKEIEELQSEYYIFAEMRLFTTEPNLNKVRVTQAFIDDIVENKENYIGLPLFIDMEKVKANFLNRLDHGYDAEKDEFRTEMVGSFYDFEKEEIDEKVCGLIGKVKIAKRNKKMVEAIKKMFAEDALNVSFEIAVKDSQDEDGILVVDKSDGNMLVGMAVVTTPACERAKTLKLVASIDTEQLKQAIESYTKEKAEIICVIKNIAMVADENENVSVVCFEADNGKIKVKESRKMDEILKEQEMVEIESAEEKPEVDQEPVMEKPTEEEVKKDDKQEKDDEEVLAERLDKLTEEVKALENRVVKLEEAQERASTIIEKAESLIAEEKKNKLKTLALRVGLDIKDENVKELIDKEDINGLLELMDSEDTKKDEKVSLASYADIKLSGEYGGLLERI